MRMKRNRIRKYYHKSREVLRDAECATSTQYVKLTEFQGEVWAASGKIQAEIYGEKLSYIRNVRIDGKYVITTDRKGIVHYVYPSGLDIVENDGICLYVDADEEPDYKIVSVKPYNLLELECMKL